MSDKIKDWVFSTTCIGKGAYSCVYKGFNIKTDTFAAIKVIIKSDLKKVMIDRMNREISLMKNFDHENIVKMYDYADTPDKTYLILEYCSGGDLYQLLEKHRLPEFRAKSYTHQLAKGLEYLRSKNITHRDLKPHNILLTQNLETIKITDFNFAKVMWGEDLSQTLCGSPLYMAPEILEGNDYTSKADLWSVGIILYEMVYGRNPFSSAINIIDLNKKMKTIKIIYPTTISDECIHLLKLLLVRKPEKRINWVDFFNHYWINEDEEVEISDSDSENECDALFDLEMEQKKKPKKTKIVIIENYVPDPVTMDNTNKRSEVYSTSVPETQNISNNLMGVISKSMNTSFSILRGTYNYLSQ